MTIGEAYWNQIVEPLLRNRKQPPKLTVITPTYNCARYIKATIDSVLNQEFQDFEYLVLDDGSRDGTYSVVNPYMGKLYYLWHENVGEAMTVNRGFNYASGEYVMVVNADDPLLPGALRQTVEFMDSHPDISVGYPDWLRIDQDGEMLEVIITREYEYAFMLRKHYCIPSVGSIIRRTVIDRAGYRDPSYRYVSDFEFWLRIGLHGKMARIPHVLACHREHPGAMTYNSRGKAMAREHTRLIRSLCFSAEAYGYANLVAGVVCWPSLRSVGYGIAALFYHPPIIKAFAGLAIKYAKQVVKR